MPSTNEAMIRSNFRIAGYVEVRDFDGQPWTLMLRRPGERPSRAPGGNLGATFQMLGRLVRLISGDSRWNVELVRGHDLANRRDSTIRATGRTKADAVDAAVRLIGELQAGKAGPDQHSTA